MSAIDTMMSAMRLIVTMTPKNVDRGYREGMNLTMNVVEVVAIVTTWTKEFRQQVLH